MPKKINLTNQKIGEWTVLREATKEQKNNKPGAYWYCKCSCGTEKIVNGQLLREGHSKSCGCKTIDYIKEANYKKAHDLTGRIFGRLTVIERDFNYEKNFNTRSQTYWKCKCTCGNISTKGGYDLTAGKIQSCGCLRKEIAQKRLSQISKNNYINEIGNKYGKLLVLYKINNDNNQRNGALWHCRCDCGNEKDVLGIDLRNGTVSSCGCLGKSKGQYYIQMLLNKNNIIFNKEYPLKINNKILRFDFAIYEENKLKYLIQFDGEQHFKPIDLFGGEVAFKNTQENDNIKNQWCKNNNISLIRIPYSHLKDLNINDLLLQTSNFII